MTKITPAVVLEEVRQMIKIARVSLFRAAASLYRIREENLFSAKFESFNDYLEDIDLDKSQASRLLTAYEHFCVKGGIEPTQLEAINPEKLYLATALDGSIKQQLTKAKTLTKQELRAERHEEKHGECTDHVPICAKCHQRL